MTARSLQADISNALELLIESELLLYMNAVALNGDVVSWHGSPGGPFLPSSKVARTQDYLDWVRRGHYSAVLPDASLLQMTYEVSSGTVTRQRLAYVPCPVLVDEQLLVENPIEDVVRMYLEEDALPALALRSPVRFDLDVAAAGADHPTAHLTLNDQDCRIACIAPMHPYRFLDFVFRHFYRDLRARQLAWFTAIEGRLLGERVLADEHRAGAHVMWDLHPGLVDAA